MDTKRKLDTDAIVAEALEEEQGRKRLKKQQAGEGQQSTAQTSALLLRLPGLAASFIQLHPFHCRCQKGLDSTRGGSR